MMAMSLQETETLFGQMLDRSMSDAEIASLLIEMAERGETAEEIAGAARAMRARMICISAPENAIDVCGTGGDGSHSLNVSTAVALVVAACGVPVAKHGNRAASSKAGAADTLEALGLNLDRAMETAEETLADLGICFLFAQKYHPALGRIAPIRKSIGRRTIFNLLGPLCNPAGVKRQLVGVAPTVLIEVYAEALALLGIEQAMIVTGDNGLDEISIDGTSTLGQISVHDAPMFANRDKFATVAMDVKYAASHNAHLTYQFKPEYVGMQSSPLENLVGGDAVYNANALKRLLGGKLETSQDHAYRDVVLLNAAGALIVAGEVNSWESGIEEAAEAIDKGLANTLLNCWIDYNG
jgi:anthranilate phosphoribosyltransferase